MAVVGDGGFVGDYDGRQLVMRRSKTAAERRQQHVRAKRRTIQRLLASFHMIRGHRGNSLNRLGLALLTVLSAQPSTAMQAGSRVPVPPPPPRPVPVARVPSVGEQVASAMRATASVFVPAAVGPERCVNMQSQSSTAQDVGRSPAANVPQGTRGGCGVAGVQQVLPPGDLSQLLAESGFMGESSTCSSAAASSDDGSMQLPVPQAPVALVADVPLIPMQLSVGMQVVTQRLPQANRNGRIGTLLAYNPALRKFTVRLASGRQIC